MGFIKTERWFKNKKALLYSMLIRGDFKSLGKGTTIYPPFHSNNPGGITIGENCSVFGGGWLDTFPEYGTERYTAKLEIGDNTYIGHRAHITACDDMKIGRNVVIADGVYISDLLHGFKDVKTPVFDQPLVVPGPVIIEDEVWLGEGVCVLPNVTIGKHSVIGSNSVVTKNIPAYSVAVGAPAKVISHYNFDTEQWDKL